MGPLKKRIIRPQEGPPDLTDIQSIKNEPPSPNPSTTLPHFINFLADGMGSRAPVIVSHVMPPAPPASSAPTEAPVNQVQMTNPSGSFSPRYFHPQQVIGIKKPIAPLAPITAHPTTTHHRLVRAQNPIDWSTRSCIVCSRRAGFRCAGCHAKAYCSSICQAVDWPKHSQLCQRTR